MKAQSDYTHAVLNSLPGRERLLDMMKETGLVIHLKDLFMRILIIVTIQFIVIGLFAQNSISNTKWKATLLIPHAVDVNFTFKKDTLSITTQTSEEVGTIFFIQRNDTLMIRKISGSSPCPEQSQGLYRIEWLENGNKFRLHGISDECEGRAGVFTTNPFERIPDK